MRAQHEQRQSSEVSCADKDRMSCNNCVSVSGIETGRGGRAALAFSERGVLRIAMGAVPLAALLERGTMVGREAPALLMPAQHATNRECQTHACGVL